MLDATLLATELATLDEALLDATLLATELAKELATEDRELATTLLELADPDGTEHSLIPPAILPPKVASVQANVPVSCL